MLLKMLPINCCANVYISDLGDSIFTGIGHDILNYEFFHLSLTYLNMSNLISSQPLSSDFFCKK